MQEKGGAKGTRSVDATHIIDNIVIPGTIGLIRQGIKALMEELEKDDSNLYEELGGKKTDYILKEYVVAGDCFAVASIMKRME